MKLLSYMFRLVYKRALIRHFNTKGKLYLRNQVLRMCNFSSFRLYNFSFAPYGMKIALL
jgi:hypothetical protein